MKRRALRFAAIIGAASVATLAVAPAFAATTVSQASAQSVNLKVAGASLISQQVSSTNDGTSTKNVDSSTIPTLADLLPANNLIGAGVAPQASGANSDGTSYACAGIAGTGGGLVKVGNTACKLDGKPLTIDLANLNLGTALIGNTGALTTAIGGLPLIGDLLTLLGQTLDQLVGTISGAINGTPLGAIKIGGALSAIEASCVADPDKATGDTRLVDSSGGSTATSIGITLPNVGTLPLVNLPANPPPNTKVLTQLDVVTQTLINALTQELNTVLGGVLAPLNLGGLLQQIQTAVVTQVVAALQPLLQPLEQYLLNITLNKQVSSDAGRKIQVTALDAQVVPALAGSLISGEIGKVTCGPNTRVAAPTTPTPTPTKPNTPKTPDVPTVVDSGVEGKADHTARNVLGATAALMLLAGTAGLVGYRRMLTK